MSVSRQRQSVSPISFSRLPVRAFFFGSASFKSRSLPYGCSPVLNRKLPSNLLAYICRQQLSNPMSVSLIMPLCGQIWRYVRWAGRWSASELLRRCVPGRWRGVCDESVLQREGLYQAGWGGGQQRSEVGDSEEANDRRGALRFSARALGQPDHPRPEKEPDDAQLPQEKPLAEPTGKTSCLVTHALFYASLTIEIESREPLRENGVYVNKPSTKRFLISEPKQQLHQGVTPCWKSVLRISGYQGYQPDIWCIVNGY